MIDADPNLDWYKRQFPGYADRIDACRDSWQRDPKGQTLAEAVRSILPEWRQG